MAARVFQPRTHQGRIIVERETDRKVFKIEMAPAEVDKATHAVGLALRMIGQPVPHITNSPFVVRFYPDSTFALERIDADGSIPFREQEGDELISTIQMAQGMTLNEQVHGRAIPSMIHPSPYMVDSESV